MSENKDKKEKKPFYKQWWFWVIIIVAATINIVFASVYGTQAPNIFTAVSGWVSGVATVALGIIAIVQNERYEKDNEKYIQEQKELQQSIASENKQQNSFAKRMQSINDLQKHFDEIQSDLFDFLSCSLSMEFQKMLVKAHDESLKDNIDSPIFSLIGYLENKRVSLTNIVVKMQLYKCYGKNAKGLIEELSVLQSLYYNFEKKYENELNNKRFIIDNMPKDVELLMESEKRIRYLMIDSLNSYGEIISYLNNSENNDEQCDTFINELRNIWSKVFLDIHSWLDMKERETIKKETENGQDENGN